MTKVVFSFIICLACYFVILGIVAIVKKIIAKRKYKKDLEKSKEEANNETNKQY